MKIKILHLLMIAIVLTVCISGCLKPANTPAPVIPTGNFVGTFTRLHLNINNNKVDTITAQLTLTMSASTGYVIGGDTTHHAASHGSYAVDGVNIAFSDLTLPSTINGTIATPVKTHLNGVYQYVYVAGSSLQIQAVGDTLAYYYNMKAK